MPLQLFCTFWLSHDSEGQKMWNCVPFHTSHAPDAHLQTMGHLSSWSLDAYYFPNLLYSILGTKKYKVFEGKNVSYDWELPTKWLQ